MTTTDERKIPEFGVPLPAEQFEYIADLLKELRSMALGLEADVLAHIIEVAMLEALLQFEIETNPEMNKV